MGVGTRAIHALALVLLLAPRAAAGAAIADHSSFDRLLRENVRGGLVDYRHIRAARLHDLDAYLDSLAVGDPASLPHPERLAFLINLYNATMIRAAAVRSARPWAPSDSGFAVFHEPLVRWRGGAISLDSLEHGVIRREFDEPRVHVALVCAARSCPPILPRAYRGEDLERTLERNLQAFAADSSRNRADQASRTLYLSRLFDWYAHDFDRLGGPVAILSRARGRDFRGWAIRWLDYDWTLNEAR
jgi:hypothetical protein